jgi:isoaspartyl peptidase/L-asparaginase-like protein (Ntn-hydrolase superfamily)
MTETKAVLLVHGGAGTVRKSDTNAEREALESALRAGFDALQAPGGSSLDAVEAAIPRGAPRA